MGETKNHNKVLTYTWRRLFGIRAKSLCSARDHLHNFSQNLCAIMNRNCMFLYGRFQCSSLMLHVEAPIGTDQPASDESWLQFSEDRDHASKVTTLPRIETLHSRDAITSHKRFERTRLAKESRLGLLAPMSQHTIGSWNRKQDPVTSGV